MRWTSCNRVAPILTPPRRKWPNSCASLPRFWGASASRSKCGKPSASNSKHNTPDRPLPARRFDSEFYVGADAESHIARGRGEAEHERAIHGPARRGAVVEGKEQVLGVRIAIHQRAVFLVREAAQELFREDVVPAA